MSLFIDNIYFGALMTGINATCKIIKQMLVVDHSEHRMMTTVIINLSVVSHFCGMNTINRTPIKRSPHIVSLSQDHHHALLLIWKIRQGIKCEVDNKRIISYALYFYNNFLKKHFREEENCLFCLLPGDDTARIQAYAEHELIKPLFLNINLETCSYKGLSEIASILEAHIRFEERVLFPHLEISCSETQLEQIAIVLAKTHVPIVEHWEDQFWNKEAP